MIRNSISYRTLRVGDGSNRTQKRFECPVHGFFDLFVYPNAEARHAKCGQDEQPSAIGLELPKAMAKAA